MHTSEMRSNLSSSPSFFVASVVLCVVVLSSQFDKHWLLLSLPLGLIIHQKNPGPQLARSVPSSTNDPNVLRFLRLALCGFNEGGPFVEAQSDSDLPADAHLQPGQFLSFLPTR
jgi:hypothetical protein